MPRQTIAPIVVAGPYDALPITNITWTPTVVADGHQVALNGDQLILVRNTGVGARTVTVNAVNDPFGRTTAALTAVSIPAGQMRVLPRFPITGWRQADGMLYLTGEHAEVEFAVLDLRNNRGGLN